ncbi:tetratricopeptide repeat protein [Microbacterium sp. G2-8]|uniref:tetratricopeptide repeat protein n=1 Tax=Microbacterium sp. G2-8 TaxID=2842454 RepID=UPI001C89EB9B|nr:tetratricopeptide repeat protein [Microbacterium sp. G2-8]
MTNAALADWNSRVDALWADDSLSPAELVERMTALSEEAPHRALGFFELAGAYDSTGDERAAARHYERALDQGLARVDPPRAAQLAVQYGSTLRNIGRIDDALALLQDAPVHESTGSAPAAFLALALHSAGRPEEALRVALDALAPTLPRYERSVRAYAADLTT